MDADRGDYDEYVDDEENEMADLVMQLPWIGSSQNDIAALTFACIFCVYLPLLTYLMTWTDGSREL
jgi:hypothetical protein